MEAVVVVTPRQPIEVKVDRSGTTGPVGPPGPQGAPSAGIPVFVQSTQPTLAQLNGATQYVWWDTSGGNLTCWIEDGT